MSADVQLPCMLETYGDGDHNGYKMSHMQILLMCGDGDPNTWNMQTLRCGIFRNTQMPLKCGSGDTNVWNMQKYPHM